ncbi:2-C-methyl-D-erythritol 2,4-cyclodiphosphate synthase [Candidatus Peregrinibacteria bacterium]|jgi:2-C-methyl-D-erythritol 4-phosphate cytidylyltransferase / 2-C-methyl-D-erythritol 2,4-cyclodiphosphate synthase|nr:2-C-methyl-D-erythritol 2,4-cyclodiphosphate synthase [Candidatus Peregrinibacteria bacterium]
MNHAIILAAGQGQRMSMKKDKMLLSVAGKPLIYYALMAFNDHPEIDSITLVANKDNKKELEAIIGLYHFSKAKKVIVGGLLRQNSVWKGIESVKAEKNDIILVHNGANPLPSLEEISECLKKTEEIGACIVGHKMTSTVKETDGENVIKTHSRENLFSAETPQAATYLVMEKAYKNAKKAKEEYTDEAMMIEAIGQKVATVEAHENNFKITTQADYAKLRMILGDLPDDFRIGIGQDSHMFDKKKKGLTIGGLKMPEEQKLEGNSDGDVVMHAVFNALSQAIGDMSLGFYADEMCEKGVKDSKKYVEKILQKIKKQKFKINSVGIMIEAATPKIDPLVPKMKKELKDLLETTPQRVGITATSGEKCTVFGEGLGIQCFAIISLRKEKEKKATKQTKKKTTKNP